jgi:hypothetical protein
MTENNKIINDLSLEFFLNKETYSKHLEKRSAESKKEYKKDKRFYRKRIYELTKQLINEDDTNPVICNKDLHFAFEMYSKICIEYFKILDKNDILQEDYSHLLNSSSQINIDPNLSIENINSIEEADQLLMRSIKIVEPNSLEKLVKRKSTKSIKKELPLPIQKNIDLKNPILKKKGIKEKIKELKVENISK